MRDYFIISVSFPLPPPLMRTYIHVHVLKYGVHTHLSNKDFNLVGLTFSGARCRAEKGTASQQHQSKAPQQWYMHILMEPGIILVIANGGTWAASRGAVGCGEVK